MEFNLGDIVEHKSMEKFDKGTVIEKSISDYNNKPLVLVKWKIGSTGNHYPWNLKLIKRKKIHVCGLVCTECNPKDMVLF